MLALGSATRLLPLIANTRKSYVCELVLGRRTDTGDAAGRPVDVARPPPDALEKVKVGAASLVGEIDQTPPMHSAVKVGGRPLYKSARRGVSVVRPPRRVAVHSIRVLDAVGPVYAGPTTTMRLAIECGAGVYVRTLCEQIGERIGVPTHMGALVRTASGPFRIGEAKLPFEIAREPRTCLIDPLNVLEQPRVALSPSQAAQFAHGNPVAASDATLAREVLVMDGESLVGVGTIKPDLAGWLFPTRVFANRL